RKKGSSRRNKMRIMVAKAHEKIFNQRRDFHFKIARKLLQANDTIYIENMNHFKSFRALNRSMRDVAWFNFFNILLFKAEEAEKEVVKVPAKNTSQKCSNCQKLVPKELSCRIHNCPHCGLSIDRDTNAARNVLRLGQSLRGAEALASAMN
ncbi:transposase, partial [Candidatus Aerophobetes bacterium Ae_b3b]